MQRGDRIRITKMQRGHPDLSGLVGACGTITEVVEPLAGDSPEHFRFEVKLDEPFGLRKILTLFPLYPEEVERLT